MSLSYIDKILLAIKDLDARVVELESQVSNILTPPPPPDTGRVVTPPVNTDLPLTPPDGGEGA